MDWAGVGCEELEALISLFVAFGVLHVLECIFAVLELDKHGDPAAGTGAGKKAVFRGGELEVGRVDRSGVDGGEEKNGDKGKDVEEVCELRHCEPSRGWSF